MEIEKRLAILQNTYAASIAESVTTYEGLNVLDAVVGRRKERQAQTAPYLNRQLDIKNIEEIFCKLSEIFACADWKVEKKGTDYVATATSCKLCAFCKKMGKANPCDGWCLDPMIAMICALGEVTHDRIAVESTLMNGERCKITIK